MKFRTTELHEYLPKGWRVVPRSDRLVLIAPTQEWAIALQVGARRSIEETAKRLERPVEITWERR